MYLSTKARSAIVAILLLFVLVASLSILFQTSKKNDKSKEAANLVESYTKELRYSGDFTSTLPVILLNGDFETWVDKDTIVNMTIINKGDKEYFLGQAEISIHGASSRDYIQKSLNLKSLHSDGSNYNFPFFGFPKGKDWILVNHYNDRAIMRNSLSFELFRQTGRYAPRYQHCEVFMNDVYAGVYLFVEKITQDKDRVDISKLKEDDISGNALTGGYIWKYDIIEGFVIQYPKKKNITPEQSNYLFNNTIPKFLGELWNANDQDRQKIMNENSFIDYFLISELSANVDGFKKSRYFFKDRDDKDPRIHAGPVWDFDWAWKFLKENVNNTEIPNIGFEWMFKVMDPCCGGEHPQSYATLFQSEDFHNKTIKRWFELRETIYSEENIFGIVDKASDMLNSAGAVQRHFQAYPDILLAAHNEVYVPFATDYESELANLKVFITTRLNFIDKNIHNFTTEI